MRFIKIEDKIDNKLFLVYREEDYSFDTISHPESYTSLTINDLQIEINEEGRLLYVWGFCPLIVFSEISVSPTNYSSHMLVAILTRTPIPGISIPINEIESWPLHWNKKEGWICIGKPVTNLPMIEFAPNCIAALDTKEELVGIWLRPQYIKNS